MIDLSWNSLEGNNLTELFGILAKFEFFRFINIEGNPCDSNKDEIKSLLTILSQDSLKNKIIEKKENIDNKDNKIDNINNDDLKWMFKKGKFIKKNKFYTRELFIQNYIEASKDN